MLTRGSCQKTDEFLGAFEFNQLIEEKRVNQSETLSALRDTEPSSQMSLDEGETETAHFVAIEDPIEAQAEESAKEAEDQIIKAAIAAAVEDYLAESDDIDLDNGQTETMASSLSETPMAMPAPASSGLATAPWREEFIQLGKVILQARESQKLQVLAICGAARGDGTSFVTNNLSQALAESGELRIGRFEINPSNSATLEMVKNDTKDSFQIAIRRTPIANISEITTPRGGVTLAELTRGCDTHVLFEMLRKRFDLILLDLPAITAEEETAQFAALTDGVVIIAQQDGDQRSPVRPARALLAKANARVLGVVLNHRREASDANVRQVA